MAPSTTRILKRRGQLTLVESANPAMGIGYLVRKGTIGLWNGEDLSEAERQFEAAQVRSD